MEKEQYRVLAGHVMGRQITASKSSSMLLRVHFRAAPFSPTSSEARLLALRRKRRPSDFDAITCLSSF